MNKFEALLLGLVTISQWALILRSERKAPELVFFSKDANQPRAPEAPRASGWVAPRRLIVKKDKEGVVLSAEEVTCG